MCRTPSWSHCVWCVCNCSLLVVFQCLVYFFFLTVKHQCNEVLPSFGIGVSSATLTRWEISVFSCWQSIYLPSNVEYVFGMNAKRRGKMEVGKRVEIAVYVHFCSEKLSFQWNYTTFYGPLHYSEIYNHTRKGVWSLFQ